MRVLRFSPTMLPIDSLLPRLIVGTAVALGPSIVCADRVCRDKPVGGDPGTGKWSRSPGAGALCRRYVALGCRIGIPGRTAVATGLPRGPGPGRGLRGRGALPPALDPALQD